MQSGVVCAAMTVTVCPMRQIFYTNVSAAEYHGWKPYNISYGRPVYTPAHRTEIDSTENASG